jgi:hypothetical protein
MTYNTNNELKALTSKRHLVPNIRELVTSILCANIFLYLMEIVLQN